MSEPRDFGELFAVPLVRHSTELASTLWGASLCVLDQSLEATFPAVAPMPLVEMFNECTQARKIRAELELHASSFFVSAPDWTGPRWIAPLPGLRLLVTPIGAATGVTYLLTVPFVYYKETEAEEQEALTALLRNRKNPLIRGAEEMVPSLAALERRKLQTHMSTLGRELDLLLSRQTRRLEDAPRKSSPVLPGLLGTSPSIETLKREVKVLAGEDAPLLVCGELGTGKRSLVRTLHNLSNRKASPLVEVDFQSTPIAELLPAVLGRNWTFGDVPEMEKTVGNGTLLLTEVAFVPPVIQQLLVKYLDEWETPGRQSFRIVATSAYAPDALEKLGTLRPELLSLLRANVTELPPLRRRKEDIPAIAADMLLRVRATDPDAPAEMDREVLRTLQAYDWPGNLWELKGEVRAMALHARGRSSITPGDVSQRLISTGRGPLPGPEPDQWVTLPEAVENLERNMLMEALGATRWNRSKTAKLLGVSRRNLIRKITRYQLDRRKRSATPTDAPDTPED